MVEITVENYGYVFSFAEMFKGCNDYLGRELLGLLSNVSSLIETVITYQCYCPIPERWIVFPCGSSVFPCLYCPESDIAMIFLSMEKDVRLLTIPAVLGFVLHYYGRKMFRSIVHGVENDYCYMLNRVSHVFTRLFLGLDPEENDSELVENIRKVMDRLHFPHDILDLELISNPPPLLEYEGKPIMEVVCNRERVSVDKFLNNITILRSRIEEYVNYVNSRF